MIKKYFFDVIVSFYPSCEQAKLAETYDDYNVDLTENHLESASMIKLPGRMECISWFLAKTVIYFRVNIKIGKQWLRVRDLNISRNIDWTARVDRVFNKD